MTCLRPLTGPAETPLLFRRMVALRLDVEGWRSMAPEMFDDLRASCVACSSPDACDDDLGTDVDDPGFDDWRDYCPNAARLRMLVALQGAMTMKLTPV